MMGIYRKLVGYTNRVNYWSCSKFADRLRKIFKLELKPLAKTSEGWDEWHAKNKKINKVANWIIEEGLDYVQDTVYFPYDVYHNIRRYVRNRWIDKTHLIDTKLSKGDWHETEEVLLHGVMERLVQFVEGEKAHMYDLGGIWGAEDFVPIKDRREAALKHLDWEISLVQDEEYFGTKKDDPEYGKPTEQSKCASETKEIYLWWKDIRPTRPDPMDVSGWSEYCEKNDHKLHHPKKDNELVRSILKKTHEIEQAQDDEDTEMLCRVIKIRKGLWT